MLMFVLLAVLVISVVSSSLFGWIREIRPVVRRRELRTGDILASTPKSKDRYTFNVAGITCGHTMMAVIDDVTGEQEFLEITGYHDWPEGDTRPGIHLMSERFDDPDRNEYVSVWRLKQPIKSSQVREYLKLVKDCKFNYSFITEHLKQRFIGIKRSTDNDKLCCSELVYLCLVYCGVLKYNENDFVDSFRFLLSGLPTHSTVHDLID